MRFKDKVVLVTGASRGIGRATALLFAKEGAKVVVNYIEKEGEAKGVVEDIKDSGSEGMVIKCDVSKEDQVKAMVEEAIKRFGRIDILINNAGIVYDVLLLDKTVEQWKETLETNLIGTFLCSKYVSKEMNDGGAVVNISSTNGINSLSPEAADYDASKAGVISLTKNLAEELAPRVRVNSVAPGWVSTEMNKDLPEDFVKEETDKIFMKRFARPEEIAKTVLFLASDEASYITGSTVVVDGGYK